MSSQIFDSLQFDPLFLFAYLFVIFTAFPVHEFAHAAAAVRLGDKTPIRQGRYTLNPLAHLSLIGSFALFLFGFGWAKPIRVDPAQLKHPKRDCAIIALMGPFSNILLALITLIVRKVLIGVNPSAYRDPSTQVIFHLLSIILDINLILAVFNLLPIPPLDGSKLLALFLPHRAYQQLVKHEGAVTVVLLLLLYTGYLYVPLNFLRGVLFSTLNWLTIPIDKLFGLTF